MNKVQKIKVQRVMKDGKPVNQVSIKFEPINRFSMKPGYMEAMQELQEKQREQIMYKITVGCKAIENCICALYEHLTPGVAKPFYIQLLEIETTTKGTVLSAAAVTHDNLERHQAVIDKLFLEGIKGLKEAIFD